MWGTAYNGGLYDKDDKPAGKNYNYEKHFLTVINEAEVSFILEFFGWWRVRYTLQMVPFEFHPFEFWLVWYRPENDWSTAFESFDVNIYTSAFVRMLEFQLYEQEQFRVCQSSVVDYI